MKLFHFVPFFCCIYNLNAIKYEDFENGLLPTVDACGREPINKNLNPRAGAEVEDYPWLVFVPLEQRRPIEPDPKFRCSGSLISKRYFITGLYCLEYFMRNVYIGQYDTSNNDTCGAFGCKPVKEIGVERWVADYEIALVRLKEDVEFSEYVQPICLPFENFPKADIGDDVYSSGWGWMYPRGDYAKVKKNIKQILVSNEQCEETGVWVPENAKVMCTKVKLEEITNIPCFGDDGAAIMHRTPSGQWVLQGLLPTLLRQCVIDGPGRGAVVDEEVLRFIQRFMYE